MSARDTGSNPVTALITNDDGIESPGLHQLAVAALSEGLSVIVAAPQAQSSGSSASIIGAETDGSISFERRELDGLENIPAFAVDAAPALIALIAAHGAFGPVPDLVLSGINRGANVGRAILHSGTVGAALTGGVNGARGLAVSLNVGMNPLQCFWKAPVPFVRELLPVLLQQPQGTVFNLNVPNTDGGVLQLREGTLATFGIVQTTMAKSGEETVRLSVSDTPTDQDAASDAALLDAGFATVTNILSIVEASTPALVAAT
ncbi:5'/3'-nucleotidase SurE [Parafrigoribacterium mesophilum]|uniref:5'/3'-nucleotidase SurE n=1 Tax=Parafrigoribacterium mesophilum TaxID=433646 RepID=UPI0031FDA793